MDRKATIGKTAFLRDVYCRPKEIAACTVIAPSAKGPDYVIVEWTKERWYHDEPGDVSAMPLAQLRFPDLPDGDRP